MKKAIKQEKAKKGQGWAKPEKALTKKQMEKMERRKAREREGKKYKDKAANPGPYFAYFYPPTYDIVTFVNSLGNEEKVLDPVRAQYECPIWVESGPNVSQTLHYF